MTTPNEELLARAKRLRHELGDSNSRLDRQCVTAMYEMEQALQSQAERIKELELDLDVQAGSIDAVQAANSRLAAERDTLRAEIADAELHTKQVERGLDKATAQLAEIAATEPVGYAVPTFNFDNSVIKPVHYAGTVPLFTHPMPAQGMTELVEAFEHHIEQTRPIERSTIALSKYKGAKL